MHVSNKVERQRQSKQVNYTQDSSRYSLDHSTDSLPEAFFFIHKSMLLTEFFDSLLNDVVVTARHGGEQTAEQTCISETNSCAWTHMHSYYKAQCSTTSRL